jgi:hypothetical protein
LAESYPENTPEAFYVEKDLCITCRAPEFVASDLIGFHEDPSGSNARSHCYFKKQPEQGPKLTARSKPLRRIVVEALGTLVQIVK